MILIERDERVVELWRILLGMEVAELLSLPRPCPGERSDDLLVAFAAGRTTRGTPEQFQVTDRMAQRWGPMVRRIAGVLDECRHFDVRHGDYRDAPDVQATWFIDPPYQVQPGVRHDRSRGGRYRHGSQDIDYRQLSARVRSRRGQVIACDQEGASWLPWTRSIDGSNTRSRSYREMIWESGA